MLKTTYQTNWASRPDNLLHDLGVRVLVTQQSIARWVGVSKLMDFYKWATICLKRKI